MKIEKRFKLESEKQKLAKEFASEFNIAEKVMNLIVARGVDTREKLQDYLFATENDFSSPFDLVGMKEGVERLKFAIASKQRIFLVCDYDCDGLSGLGIFMRFFADKECEVESYIPEREEGYGLNFENIKPRLEAFKPHLLITCDLGITAIKETQQIKEMGIDVLITDHHLPKETLPNTTVINPKIQTGVTEFCGAGVVFKLMQGMGEDYKKYVELATIATIGDSVPMVKENRLIVKAGLSKMNSDPDYMIEELKSSAKIAKFDSQNIAFTIVPRMNAGGRMGQAKVVKELVSKKEYEYSKIKDLCETLSQLNAKRQEFTSNNFQMAREIAIQNSSQKVLVVYHAEFFVGILGIIASKIAEEFNRPTVVLSKVGEEIKGSARSVGNIDIHSKLAECSEFFTAFGGHKMACGLSLEEKNLNAFKKKMSEVASEIPNEEFEEYLTFDEEVSPAEVTTDFIYSLEAMEPFGESNATPIFNLKGGKTNFRMLGSSGEHIVGTCDGLKILGFGKASYMEKLNHATENDLLVNLQMDRYMGRENPSSILRNILSKEHQFISEEVCLFDVANGENQIATLEEIAKNVEESPFSTLVIIPSKVALESVKTWDIFNKFMLEKSRIKQNSGRNTILVNPKNADNFHVYQNIYSVCGIIPKDCEESISKRIKVIPKTLKTNELKEKITRETFTSYYKMLKTLDGGKYFRVLDIHHNLMAKFSHELSKQTLFFTVDVLRELGILDVKNQTLNFTNVKSALENSTIYMENQEGE